jgi:hypothetical protein
VGSVYLFLRASRRDQAPALVEATFAILVDGVHQRGTAASAGSGFDTYGLPLASRAGSDGCHLDVCKAAPCNIERTAREQPLEEQ